MRTPSSVVSLLLGLLGSALVTFAADAAAQTLPSIDARTWRPSGDPNAGLNFEPVTTPGPWQWNLTGWLHYTQDPITLRRAGTTDVASRPVINLLGADFVANVGLGQRAAFGLSLPTALYQHGTGGLPSTIATTGEVPSSALGDIGLHGKATIISNVRKGLTAGFGLAALGALTLPTGDRASYLTDGSTTASLRLLAEYTLVVASVHASLGYKLRTAHNTWPDPTVGGIAFGDEIPWSIGASLRPGILSEKIDEDNRQTWELGAHGWLPAGPTAPFASGAAALSPVLLGVSDRIAIGHYRDMYAVVGVEVGLSSAVGVPAFRAVAGFGWAPRAHDRDDDGIPDDADLCPDDAEDLDGIDDHDGCPEDDADQDGILDRQDACPHVAGVWWNDPKRNGCPAPDTDGDGIFDPLDACPHVKGVASDDPKKNGCPVEATDQDDDGISDDKDRCPTNAEDIDGFEDEDGCPELDNDTDGVPDLKDACPNTKGQAHPDYRRNGCPNPDRDGDSYLNEEDKCPDEAEVYNGIKDDDGCPDEGGKPLVTIDTQNPKLPIKLASPIKLTGKADAPEVDPASVFTLRAFVLELNRHVDWTLFIGARPGAGKPDEAQRAAVNRAAAISSLVDKLALRDEASEAVGWDAVKQQPGSENGIAFMIVVAPATPGSNPTPLAPAPGTTSPPATPTPPSGATPVTPAGPKRHGGGGNGGGGGGGRKPAGKKKP